MTQYPDGVTIGFDENRSLAQAAPDAGADHMWTPDAPTRVDWPDDITTSLERAPYPMDNIEDGDWSLHDRSLNGTFVQKGAGWQRVLSAPGRDRLRSEGEDPTDRHGNVPPEAVTLTDGDLVSLVHPTYGVTFEFHPEES